jgi:spore coat polysaccharide biosynthesis protein SpsF
VQARVGSSRLPGKVLRPFGRSTLLGHIVERLRGAGDLWIATTTAVQDDRVAAIAADCGVPEFRGSEADVLDRFAACVRGLPETPELVVRMTADRPFASAELVTQLLEAYDQAGAPDYLSNTLPRKSYPDGLDVEVVATRALLEAANEAVDPYDREHVTPFLYRQPDRYRLAGVPCAYGNFASVRATIDTEEDYEKLRAVVDLLGPEADWRELLTLAELEPDRFP